MIDLPVAAEAVLSILPGAQATVSVEGTTARVQSGTISVVLAPGEDNVDCEWFAYRDGVPIGSGVEDTPEELADAIRFHCLAGPTPAHYRPSF